MRRHLPAFREILTQLAHGLCSVLGGLYDLVLGINDLVFGISDLALCIAIALHGLLQLFLVLFKLHARFTLMLSVALVVGCAIHGASCCPQPSQLGGGQAWCCDWGLVGEFCFFSHASPILTLKESTDF